MAADSPLNGARATKYRTIVADPPWQYGANRQHPTSAEAQYRTMPVSEIASLPVGELAEGDAHLYMWVTNPVLTEQRLDGTACGVARAWGFSITSAAVFMRPLLHAA